MKRLLLINYLLLALIFSSCTNNNKSGQVIEITDSTSTDSIRAHNFVDTAKVPMDTSAIKNGFAKDTTIKEKEMPKHRSKNQSRVDSIKNSYPPK